MSNSVAHSVKIYEDLNAITPSIVKACGYENLSAFINGCLRECAINPGPHLFGSKCAKLSWPEQDKLDARLKERFLYPDVDDELEPPVFHEHLQRAIAGAKIAVKNQECVMCQFIRDLTR